MLASVHGLFQARILKWVAISFSRGSSQPKDQTHVSCIADGSFTTESLEKALLSSMSPLYVLWILALIIIDFVVQLLSHFWPFATPWTAAQQASLSLTISWSLPKFMSTECMMLCDWPSYPLPPSSPFALSCSQHQGIFQRVHCLHQVAKVSEG